MDYNCAVRSQDWMNIRPVSENRDISGNYLENGLIVFIKISMIIFTKKNLDYWAKHWVIEVQKGEKHRLRQPSSKPKVKSLTPPNIQGSYQVKYRAYDGIKVPVQASQVFELQVTLQNTGFLSWSSQDPDRPVFISYHWRDRSGKTIVYDGRRTSFHKEIRPGEEAKVPVSVKAPDLQGRFILEIDCVCEGVTWFSEAKNKALSIPVQVKKRQ